MVVVSTLLIYYLAGLIVAFSPCLFPVLPTFITYISAKKSARNRAFLASILFSLGLTLSFTTYSLLGVFAKELVMPLLTLSLENIIASFAVLLIALGIAMLTPFREVTARISVPSLKIGKASLLDALILGFFFSLLAAPCAASSILAIVAGVVLTSGGGFVTALLSAVLQIVVYSLGVSTPFIILGILTQELSTRIHKKLSKSFLVRYNEVITALLLIIYGSAILLSLGNFIVYLDYANRIVEGISYILWIIFMSYFSFSLIQLLRNLGDKYATLLLVSLLLELARILLNLVHLYVPDIRILLPEIAPRAILVVSLLVYLIIVPKKSALASNRITLGILPFIGLFESGNLPTIVNFVLIVEFLIFYLKFKNREIRWMSLGLMGYVLYGFKSYILNLCNGAYTEVLDSLFVSIFFALAFSLYPISYKNIHSSRDLREIYEI
ncbi:MAG: hypothetical protein DRJ64_03330 [Thermoprotei archaeon]|nr:MAG: hypothetical protein DRJ64_03330 [Thermoprotei archaeon]